MTPLLSAIFNGLSDIVEILYEYEGLNPFLWTKYGYNNLELASSVLDGYRTLQMIIEREQKGLPPYPGLDLNTENEVILLHTAINNDALESFQTLV